MNLKIAIIGAGMAGVSAGKALKTRGCSGTLFEKSRGFGNRCATKRWEGHTVDHGARYFTIHDERFHAAVQAASGEARRICCAVQAASGWGERGECYAISDHCGPLAWNACENHKPGRVAAGHTVMVASSRIEGAWLARAAIMEHGLLQA